MASLKILIADDNYINRAILSTLTEKMGHRPIHAEDGAQAVKLFEQEQPDLVLMDVMMPGMDGMEATSRIKKLSSKHWTPIIMVTALEDDEDMIRGLEAGADDYLRKPVNGRVLTTKINSIERALELQRQLASKTHELQNYYFAAEEEKRIASHIMQSMTAAEGLHDPALEYWLSPAEACSGDLIAAARTPGGVLHVMLADGTGHGLAAALNILPLPQIFYAMTGNGYGISSIATEMNAKLKNLLPADRFIAVTLASIDPYERVVDVWNGGNPDTWLVDNQGTLVHKWKSTHLPLGILDKQSFDASTETFHFDNPKAQLVIFSDGLPEAGNEHREPFGMERLLESLCSSAPRSRMENLRNTVSAYLENQKAHDDISLVMVNTARLESTRMSSALSEPMPTRQTSSPWRMSFHFGSFELQNVDIVPFTIDLLKKLHITGMHLGSLFLIISELFNNALDHGLLKLDSRLKEGVDGFERYLTERAVRLANLDPNATVELEFEHIPKDGKSTLRLSFKDNGPGFDYEAATQNLEQLDTAHGRGVALVNNLATSMRYIAPGNKVIVEYTM